MAIQVDSRRRRRGEVESVPFLLFPISASCCFRVLFFVQCWTHRDEGEGGNIPNRKDHDDKEEKEIRDDDK